MNPINELRFAVSDRIIDAEVGPKHVSLSLLGDFQKDVSDFLKGSGRDVDPAEVLISVEDGSLALVATGLLAATTLWSDLERLQSPDSLKIWLMESALPWSNAGRLPPGKTRIENTKLLMRLRK